MYCTNSLSAKQTYQRAQLPTAAGAAPDEKDTTGARQIKQVRKSKAESKSAQREPHF